MATYRIEEADGAIKFVDAESLAEAVRKAVMPHAVAIDEDCPASPEHDFIPFKGLEDEGKSRFCRICGLMR